MLVSCKVCHREYVASKKPDGDDFVCTKCQVKPKKVEMRLGLHPALEKKWAHNQEKNPTSHGVSDRSTIAHNQASNKRASLSDSSSLPKIPGFDISYQIGRGAMGSVYRARQIKTGQLVAIKVLSHDLTERADLVARFEREAYALKSLTDPNVVTIIDAGNVDDTHYFAMEFIDGITLRTRINRSPISLEESCFITKEILSGLMAAHKHGIIHRDLKPENVLLAYEDRDFSRWPKRVVLVDFGLVGIGGLLFDPHPNLTRSRVTMGTVNYMAPEQHVDAKRVDHRSDLYSAGVIFFEMLTKELPLGRYLLPHERGMNVTKDVDDILAKALSRSPDARYSSSLEFLHAVKMIDSLKAQTADVPTHEKNDDLVGKIRAALFKGRYALLIATAVLFFAFGIKMSLAQTEDAQAQQTTTATKKNLNPQK